MLPGRMWLVIAGLLGALAVAFGAFQSHGLESYLGQYDLKPEAIQERLRMFDVGVRYQFHNALAVMGIGIIRIRYASRLSFLAGLALLLGTVLFSGMLYYIAASGDHTFGIVAAWGGSIQIVGWVLLAFSAFLLQERD